MKLSELVGFLTEPEEYDVLYRGSKVEYLDDACRIDDDSRFFVVGHEFGATHLIHVESRREGFEAAWELWIDESPTIPEDELVEAFGPGDDKHNSFKGLAIAEIPRDAPAGIASDAWREKVNARAKEMLEACEEPELIEGYEYQSNSSGTGIVDVGHCAWMNEADLDDVEIVRREK